MASQKIPFPSKIEFPYQVPILLESRLILIQFTQIGKKDPAFIEQFESSFKDKMNVFDLLKDEKFEGTYSKMVNSPNTYEWYRVQAGIEGEEYTQLLEDIRNFRVEGIEDKLVRGLSATYHPEKKENDPNFYSSPLPDRIILKFNQRISRSKKEELLKEISEEFGLEECPEISDCLGQNLHYMFLEEFDDTTIFEIKQSLETKYAQVLEEVYLEYVPLISPLSYTPKDPLFHTQENWNMRAIFAGSLDEETMTGWDISRGDCNVTIAVLDEGIQEHEDLRYCREGYQVYYSEDDDFCHFGSTGLPISGTGTPYIYDPNMDHGTQVAGIACAKIDNNIGISGLAGKCSLVSMNIGKWTWVELVCAIHLSLREGAKVINMSFGWSYEIQVQTEPNLNINIICGIQHTERINIAINDAIQAGLILCAASGNDFDNLNGKKYIEYPACHPKVMACGASSIGNSSDPHIPPGDPTYPMTQQLAYFSHFHKTPFWDPNNPEDLAYLEETMISVVAPGEEINTTMIDPLTRISNIFMSDTGNLFRGTSAACPHVAGLAALIISINSKLSPIEVRNIIEETAVQINATDEEMGSGQIHVYEAALTALLTKYKFPRLFIRRKVLKKLRNQKLKKNSI